MATPRAAIRTKSPAADRLDLALVGGAGHVGLPLALSFAESGCRVGVYDEALDLALTGR